MIYIAWFEIVYSILDFAIAPIMFSDGSILVVMVHTKYSPIPSWILLMLTGCYCFCFGASMGMFALHFIYRYFVSTGSKYLKTFNGYRIIYWMMIPVIYGLIWGFICYFVFSPSDEINRMLKNKLMITFGWEIEDIVYLGPYFHQLQPDGSYVIDLTAVVGVAGNWIIIFSSLCAILYFAIKCYWKISRLMKMKQNNDSNNLKNLQSQLFNALVTQTVIPVILMHFPLTTILIFAVLNKDLGTLSGISSITIALFPALDPLPSMFIIKNYRTTIFGYFKITKVKSASVPLN
ncbi:unnamed protein product [Caenorhabditis angaria]|uniref:Seven TM Receptor n=1 Tax=Caenorhabditis angaria TaxID=860376 RepID=A0A9P1N6L3_9PELO|nr:unnamed protein product [Caenorhabditis angaria]